MIISDFKVFIETDLELKTEIIRSNDNRDFLIIKDFSIKSGEFTDKVVSIGVLFNSNNPYIPLPSIQIKPHITEFGPKKSIENPKINIRNILNRSFLGTDWQYWSMKIPNPPKSPEDFWASIMRMLLGEINETL